MTSFTKALYRRDPKAAEEFYRQQQFEQRHTYGRVPTLPEFTFKGRPASGQGFTLGFHTQQAAVSPYRKRDFGKRLPTLGTAACSGNCGHPACSQGCTLQGKA